MTAHSKSALIVDDNRMVRSALKSFLEVAAGLIVSEAADGAEAVNVAQELKPDLIIMDLVMPNLNGLEAASIIRRLVPDARIVIFTLHSGDVGPSLMRAAGVDVVVEKIRGATGLMSAVQKILADDDGHVN